MESEKILQEMHKSSLYEEHTHHPQSYESQTDSDSDQPDTDEADFGA